MNGFFVKKGEPMVRFELTTYGLRNRCSATELHRPTQLSRIPHHPCGCQAQKRRRINILLVCAAHKISRCSIDITFSDRAKNDQLRR